MTELFMKSKKAIGIHFSDNPTTKGVHIFTGFTKCLKEAREVTGRNPSNGTLVNPTQQENWLGAIGYMALLDQIGTCFKPKGATEITGNTIKKTLGYFTSISEIEIDALYALRCAFAHDFSLYNVNKTPTSLTHRFNVGVLSGKPLVKLPQEQWDGNYEKSSDKYKTIISLDAFYSLSEQVYANLLELWNKDELEIVLSGGSDELLQRYSFEHRQVK
jgi:hypothetical protein